MLQINSEVKSISYNKILKDMWPKVIRSNHCDVLIQCSAYKVSLICDSFIRVQSLNPVTILLGYIDLNATWFKLKIQVDKHSSIRDW